jgi:hypothetical protein
MVLSLFFANKHRLINSSFLSLLGKTGLRKTGLLVLNGYRSFGLSEHGERGKIQQDVCGTAGGTAGGMQVYASLNC